ncbi:AsmA family protein [Tenuifilum thalassicum]|uniref:AsmA family protein n=1 Tax=Tenuifilum thalassicum TaxID=2590900 RepID=A0A7D4B9T6_9BACT|nr:AsmA family protein [Tenuifilum thalassicum]QKG78920.1 AsmA family protein [Tenuifilum thalassicum]
MKALRVLGKTTKYFLISILTILSLVVLILIGVFLFEGKIVRMAVQEVEQTLKAPISYGKISVLPFRDFPNLTLRISGFNLGQQADSVRIFGITDLPDTLIGFKNVFVSVKAYPLFNNKVDINGFELNGFRLNYIVDSAGRSNFDFLIPSDTIETEPDTAAQTLLNILLKNLTLSDINLNYRDENLKAKANINIPKLHLEGKISGDSIWARSNGNLMVSNIKYENIPVDKIKQLAISYGLNYNTGKIDIDEAKIETEGIELNTHGEVILSDSIWMDLSTNIPKISLDELMKFVPEDILKDFGVNRIKGRLSANTTIRGFLYDTIMLPSIFTDIKLVNGTVETAQYPKVKNITIDATASIPNPNMLSTTVFRLKKFKVETDESKVDLALTIKNPDKPIYNINGNIHLVLDEFRNLIPDSIAKDVSGLVDANFFTKGRMPEYIDVNSTDYFMESSGFNFKLTNVSASLDSLNSIQNLNVDIDYNPDKSLKIKTINLYLPGYKVGIDKGLLSAKVIGSVISPEKIDIRIDTFFVAAGNNSLGARLKLRNLNQPQFSSTGNIKIDLDELRPFIPDTLVSYITGKIDFKFNSYGGVNLDSIEKDVMPIIFENSRFSTQVHNFGFSMPNDTLIGIDRLSFNISMANDTIRVANLIGNYKDIEFKSDSMSIWNIYKAFLKEEKNKKLIVNTSLWANKIDYAMFLPFIEEDSTQNIVTDSTRLAETSIDTLQGVKPKADTSQVDSSYMPQYIIRGIAKVDQIKYGKVLISNFSTKFRLDDSLYVVDDMRFNAFGGTAITSAIYDTRKAPQEIIEFKNQSENINIKQLLEENEDFDQNYFTHNNIEGLLTGTVYGRVVMQDTNILYDKINLLGDLTLADGGIYNFEPAMELSKFTNLKELDNIVFRTLSTKVFIYNNKIYFPKTDIVSTAMDMSVYGMQSFGDDYEYHFVVYPGDVMFGKSKKLLKKQGLKDEDFEGSDKAKRSGLYLVALERGNDTKYGFDTKALQRIMKTTIRVQERGLNLVFHPHRMNFSTDLYRKELKLKEDVNKKDKND